MLAAWHDVGVPLYLVRWPGLEAALVSAADEDELLQHLDEIANPEGCTWSVYRGPIFIELALNAEVEVAHSEQAAQLPLRPDELQLRDVTRICRRDVLSASIPLDADAAYEMVQTITRNAFPDLYAVLDTERETLPEDEVRGALRRELDALVRASWQQEQTKRRPDQGSRIAAMMGTSPRLVARWAKQAAVAEERARPTPPPEKPAGRSGKRKPKKPRATK